MKVYDCTSFYSEHMMYDVRLNVLNDKVEKFIVTESTYSHSGQKKKLNFDINNYPKFKDKIIYIVIDNEPKGIVPDQDDPLSQRLNSLKRVSLSYDACFNATRNCSSDDFIMLSDNDEIPNLEKINFEKNKSKVILFKQVLFYYKFNLYLPNIDWFGSKCCQLKNLKSINLLRAIKNKKYNFFRIDALFSDIKQQSVNIVNNGGWHFSNLKNAEELERKYINDENHAEYEYLGHSINKIKDNLKNKIIDYNHNAKKNSSERFNPTKLENIDLLFLPKYLQENKKKYTSWFDLT